MSLVIELDCGHNEQLKGMKTRKVKKSKYVQIYCRTCKKWVFAR